ncbi:hypothetical protein CVS40_7968 [Lucilia cuprina]|nr:hypothetical protein CVS40_7968 [Lucilia cuprina]
MGNTASGRINSPYQVRSFLKTKLLSRRLVCVVLDWQAMGFDWLSLLPMASYNRLPIYLGSTVRTSAEVNLNTVSKRQHYHFNSGWNSRIT